MKNLLLFVFTALCCHASAQGLQLPTEPSSDFGCTLGTKFTLRLHSADSTDSANMKVSILAIEQFREVVELGSHMNLFEKDGADSTIVGYFCLATFGQDEEARKKNMKIALFLKNYSGIPIKYSSYFMREKDSEFEPTSNVGMLPGIVMMELWPHMIFLIMMKDFEASDPNNLYSGKKED